MPPNILKSSSDHYGFAKVFLGIILGLAASFSLQAQTTWTGAGGDGVFTNNANWDNGAPGSSTAAIIDTPSTLNISLPTLDTIGSLSTSGVGTINFALSTNTLTVNGDSVTPSMFVDHGSTLSLNSGTVTLNGALDIANTSGSSGTVILNASTLQVGGTNGIAAGSGTAALNLNAGSIKVINSNLTSSVPMTLTYGTTSSIDTNGFNATFSGANTGVNAKLVKVGLGNLALTSTNAIDSFFVLAGNLNQTTGSLTSYEIGVGSGTGSVGTYTMSGGSLVLAPGNPPPPIVDATASSFRIGDFGATGTFTQTGGSVSVSGSLNIGNQGGHGTYTISAGSLSLEAGLSTLGRTSGGSASSSGSTGELDISGTATVNLHANSQFILSNWYPTTVAVQGTGILNQTGGTLAVANTATLTLTGFGTGTYNLNGGTLQIGGDSLHGVFGTQSGTYHFNLGGGTIQVAGVDLITSVHATLTASTSSTIDTNGLNATLSGALDGAGALVKTSAGTLTLSGSNAYSGGTTVNLGTLAVGSATALGTGAVHIASGATVQNATATSYDFTADVMNNGTIDSGGQNISFAASKTLSGSGILTGGATYTVNGTLSPGNSPGIVTVGALTTLSLASSSTTIWQLAALRDNNDGTAGVDWDTFILNPTGTMNLDGTLQIALDGISFSTDPYWELSHTYTLFSGGTVNGNFAALAGNSFTNSDGTGVFTRSGNSIVYTFTVPEPQIWVLAAMGLSIVFFRRLRSKRN
ncbi:MAG: autotransporter-associated beta strand repeat-containing protein [Chthoniobacterales bacterium]